MSRPETLRDRFLALDMWTRLAVVVWATIVVFLGVRCFVQPYHRTLYPTWSTAGADWLAGSDQLYRRTGQQDGLLDTFRYTPFVAATLAPWSLMPERIGGVLWRLFNAGVFLGGAWWWLRSAAPLILSERRRAVFFLCLVPLSLSSLNNGQPNPLVIGFLLAALATAAGERWWLCAAFIAFATALKLYPLALGLILVVCYPRRFTLPLLVALAAVALVPFALQRPDYVLGQYRVWVGLLRMNDDRIYWPPHMAYRDLWLLFRLYLPISLSTYQFIQVAGGAACAALCVALRLRGDETRHVLMSVLALAVCWMLLLGPATESATFILFAPALAWGLLGWTGTARVLAFASAAVLVACVLAGVLPGTNKLHGLGGHPIAVMLFVAGAVAAALRPIRIPVEGEETRELPLAA
jgi:hypothetical protein